MVGVVSGKKVDRDSVDRNKKDLHVDIYLIKPK